MGKFASKFRSRREPLEEKIAREVIQVFAEHLLASPPEALATSYIDALPYPPPVIDTDRRATYECLCAEG
jgi:hypothetical protein